MAKVKVEVLNAVVGGHKKGDVISVEENTAEMLEANYYVKRVAENKTAKAAPPKDNGKNDDKAGGKENGGE